MHLGHHHVVHGCRGAHDSCMGCLMPDVAFQCQSCILILLSCSRAECQQAGGSALPADNLRKKHKIYKPQDQAPSRLPGCPRLGCVTCSRSDASKSGLDLRDHKDLLSLRDPALAADQVSNVAQLFVALLQCA